MREEPSIQQRECTPLMSLAIQLLEIDECRYAIEFEFQRLQKAKQAFDAATAAHNAAVKAHVNQPWGFMSEQMTAEADAEMVLNEKAFAAAEAAFVEIYVSCTSAVRAHAARIPNENSVLAS